MKSGKNQLSRWFKMLYALMVLMMGLALVVFGIATWNNVKEQAYSSLAPHNTSLNQSVKALFDHQLDLLGTIANDIKDTEDLPASTKNRLNDILRATPQMRVLALIDNQGETLATTGDPQTIEWIDLFDEQSVSVGRPFRPTFVGETVLPLRKPIINDRGLRVGYIVAAYRLLGNNAVWYEADEKDSNRRSIIVGARGRVYLSFPESDTFWQSFVSVHVEKAFLSTISDLAASEKHQTSDATFQDESLLITASSISPYELYAVSGIKDTDLFSLWFERMKFVGLSVLVFLLVGMIVFRQVLSRTTYFKTARDEAVSSVSKLSQAIEQSPSSVIVTDENWLVEYANRRLADGSENQYPVKTGDKLLETFPFNLLETDRAAIKENLHHGNSWYGERRAKDQKKWFSFSVSALIGQQGGITNYVTVTQDITDRKLSEVKLYKQANFDALTGLPNRRRTNDMLTEQLKVAWKDSLNVAVLYMDLDNFKQINDTFGHLLGDQLLQLVALRLQQTAGKRGTACHMSGDEFLIFMRYDTQQDIVSMAELIMNNMKEPVMLEGKKLMISMSIGISCYPSDSDDVVGLMKHADIALYESKNLGRSRYSFFNQELDARNKRKMELETELRNALESGEIFMVYQTKNRINDTEVYGFEALMRWQSSRLGFVSPEEFIEVAEDIGVIDKLGEFALIQACRDLISYQSIVPQKLTMAVNVSMHQLVNSDIVGAVRRVLEETKIDPGVLDLEITESMMAKSLEEVQPVLNSLLELGVTLSIDDFGTGYSSLSYLTRFPVSTLKVDRCFVKDMVENQSDATLTHTVITMAHKLGLKVVAEGIEDEDQLALLRVYGCDIGQGYFFTKPLSYDQMRDHLKGTQPAPDWAV